MCTRVQVLFARLCFRTGVWDFLDGLPANATQRFYLDFNVTFVQLPQQGSMVRKPTPPLVVPLPPDIFYPFVASDSAAASVGAGGGLLWLAALLAMAALLGRAPWLG